MKRILITVTIFQILIRSTLNAVEDSRRIWFQELDGVKKFQSNNVTQLLFDVEKEQVIIGARDRLFRLELQSLRLLEKVHFLAHEDQVENCQSIGGTPVDCHNYIKVLLKNGRKLLSCGTYAFKPLCTWREIDNMSKVLNYLQGEGKCPSGPSQTVTGVLPNDVSVGLFIGTEIRNGNGGIIMKHDSSSDIISPPHEFGWLNQPKFVGSFETDTHVYFLFREFATECGLRDNKIIHSRIARVCKNDPGVQGQFRIWTTFMKARLSCHVPGDVPFYYDQIQSVVYHSEKKTFYATFTTPVNGVPGSAICAFDLKNVEKSFAGPFEHQPNSNLMCAPKIIRMHVGRTCRFNTSHHRMQRSQNHLLMHNAVESTTPRPIHLAQLERFTQIAVDVTLTKLNDRMTVLYAATTTGLIKKISVSSKTQESCVIEVWGPLPSLISTLEFLKPTQSLYVGTEFSFFRIPVVQCHRYISCRECLNVQDPYCGWDENISQCTQMPESKSALQYWHQKLNKCTTVNDISRLDNARNTTQCREKRGYNESSPTNVGSHCPGRAGVADCSATIRQFMKKNGEKSMIFLYEFVLGHGVREATRNINRAFDFKAVTEDKLEYWFTMFRNKEYRGGAKHSPDGTRKAQKGTMKEEKKVF